MVDRILRAAAYYRVIVWLLAVWIGCFYRGVHLATPKDNNLLVYTLIFLVRLAFHYAFLFNHTRIVYRSLAFRSDYLALQPQRWQ